VFPTTIPARIARVRGLNWTFWSHGSLAAYQTARATSRHKPSPAANPFDIFGSAINPQSSARRLNKGN
jgi:hypothetical protein